MESEISTPSDSPAPSLYQESSSSPVQIKRLRGRGRQRGRGRGGRGRGRARTVKKRTRADDAVQTLEERRENLRITVNAMTEVKAKDLLLKVCEKTPSLILDILDSESGSHGGGGYHPQPDGNQPSWCICHRCREMPTQPERKCCGKRPDGCISQLPDFRVLILDEAVPALARMYRQEVFALPDDDDWKRANRHTAYRQFVLWQHGRLGIGIRRVIPSCCVWEIRDRYPNDFGQYTGFIPSRIA